MQKTLALILKKQNIGETDRIITIFSPVLGKKRVVARAVRKPLSKLAGHLDTFMISQLILTDQDDLPKVTSAVLVESFENVRSSYQNLDRAFAVSKIVERVIVEDVSEQTIFQLTLDTLTRLDIGYPWQSIWLVFLNDLTEKLGIDLSDFSCGGCGQPIRDAAYWAQPERRLFCKSCGYSGNEVRVVQGNTVKLLLLLRQKSFSAVHQVRIPEAVAKEAEEIFLREITQWFNKPWQSYAALKTI